MNIQHIEEAALRLQGQIRTTPLLESPLLNARLKRRLLVKAECLQLTGSFKFRGAFSALSTLTEAERDRGVIAYSSGNHAQGVALAAQKLGIPATIVMPDDAPKIKLANTKAYGACVVTYRRGVDSREALGAELAERQQLRLIKPYDEPLVIAGQGTVGLEIAAQACEVGIRRASVLTCCGGGGLTAGVALALAAHEPEFRVIPCEPDNFDDTARSLAGSERVRNASETGSICDAIVTPEPGELTLPILRQHCPFGLTASDAEVAQAMRIAFEYFKLVVEPGGAIALACALREDHRQTLGDDPIIVTASGGNVDTGLFLSLIRDQSPDRR
jgi:threonine dehydratase